MELLHKIGVYQTTQHGRELESAVMFADVDPVVERSVDSVVDVMETSVDNRQ